MKHPESLRASLGVSVLLVCLLFLSPLFTVTMSQRPSAAPERPAAGSQEAESVTLLPPGETDSARTVRVLVGDTVREMSMAEYLQNVLRAEMPASFEQEALCAQAVAARTYTLYKMASGGNHGTEADICADSTCCQAYVETATAMANWGEQGTVYEAKIENAVAATDGQTILYGGTPILAVFHSSSAGLTKSAGEVWTGDLPYLQSVISPEKGDEVPNFYSRTAVAAEKFRTTFLAAHPDAKLAGAPTGWIGDITVTEGNNVDTVTVGGVTVRGTELRRLYGLRSASFEVEIVDGEIVFFVTGYGHGVGLSQYGANELAKEGKTWREILQHYYTGVTIGEWSGA